MANPWERYAPSEGQKKSAPWEKYASATPPPTFDEREQLRQDEGFKKNDKGQHIVYKDSLGKLTGGIGRLLEGKGNWKEGDVIPDEDVEKWFEEDYATAVSDMKSIVGDAEVPEEIKGILTNMSFQLGRTKLNKFVKTLEAAKGGKYEEMAKEMLNSNWSKQTPNRADRLYSRVMRLAKGSK